MAVNKKTVEVKSLRFYSYVRFACNEPVEVTLPTGMTIGNQLQMTIEYDDAHKKSGRVGFRRGNWNTGSNITYVTKLKSGTASVELNLQLYASEIEFVVKQDLVLGLKPWVFGRSDLDACRHL